MYMRIEGAPKHRLYEPQLPQRLRVEFEKDFPDSLIFTAHFSHTRFCMVTKKLDPNSAVPIGDLSIRVVESGRFVGKEEAAKLGVMDLYKNLSYLHLAALHGDLPLAYEARKLGTSVGVRPKPDRFSALYVGFQALRRFTRPVADEAVVAKIRRVCHFLISQWSNPNETNGGVSLLQMALQTDSWDLFRALLLHGAELSPSLVQFLDNESDKARFLSLISEFKNSTAGRPPRPCPCASEMLLKDCHAVSEGKPYPMEYICPCGSKKIYAKCCSKQTGMGWIEQWNGKGDRLELREQIFLRSTLPPSISDEISDSKLIKMFEGIGGFGAVVQERLDRLRNDQVAILRRLESSGRVDPAYVAAIIHTNILVPDPLKINTVSKGEWKETVGIWNGAVDTYIVSGVDRRASEIIENAAKISEIAGPLYRRCEAAGCANVDGRGSVQLHLCSQCKTTMYCGTGCQKSAWKRHKLACRSGKVKPQLLPSQLEHMKAMSMLTPGVYEDSLY
ncbi:hypothetical protein FB451DRAFT_1229859 [Mycena latifolia]|nr:hypothetical protein FB451DRAFT_1229859 [Mycena latifolia]